MEYKENKYLQRQNHKIGYRTTFIKKISKILLFLLMILQLFFDLISHSVTYMVLLIQLFLPMDVFKKTLFR